MERAFEISNLLVAPFWLAMILTPRWRVTQWLMRTPVGALAPAFIYALLVLPRLAEILPVVARPELGAVSALLATPAGATVAWAHFLAFDLFVGRWIYLDARARGLSAWLISPLLALTLLLGPLGLLGYLAVRAWSGSRARAAVEERAPGSAPLVGFVVAALGLLGASLVLMLVDPRQVGGASAWLKPAKFAMSTVVTAGTLALLLRWLQPVGSGVRRAAKVVAWLLALELVIITVQAARGVPSHFNASSALDGVLFSIMGAAITAVWGAIAYLGWRAFRQRFADRALGWGIRLGLVAMVAGSALGFLMTRPTPAQQQSLAAGRPTPLVGAHAVGVPDGGPGLPVTGWSAEGGDLRVPHFVGMHGLQLLPLAGWLLRRRRRGVRLTVAASVAHLGLTAVVLVQALRGQPLAAPDAATWLSLLAVLAAALAVAVLPARAGLRTAAPALAGAR